MAWELRKGENTPVYRAYRFLNNLHFEKIKEVDDLFEGQVIALCQDTGFDVRQVVNPEVFRFGEHRVDYDMVVYEEQFRGEFVLDENNEIILERFWNVHEKRDKRKAYLRGESDESAGITHSNELLAPDLKSITIVSQGVFDISESPIAEYMLSQAKELTYGRMNFYRNNGFEGFFRKKILRRSNLNDILQNV